VTSIASPNLSSLFGLRTLEIQQRAVEQSLERLATGRRVNRASDDPAGSVLLTASAARKQAVLGQIAGLEQQQLLEETASAGYAQIADALIRLQDLVTTASNTGAVTEEQREALQLEADGILDAIDDIATGTTFKGRQLLAGQGVLIGSTVETRLDARTTQLGATRAAILKGEQVKGPEGEPVDDFELIEISLDSFRTGGRLNLLDGDLSLGQDVLDNALNAVSKAAGNVEAKGLDARLKLLQGELESLAEIDSSVGDTDFARETSELARSQVLARAAAQTILINRDQNAKATLGLLG
jgi:flagellin